MNGLGAATQLSGLGIGAYRDSVVDGETKLAAQIKKQLAGACAATPIVLVGYSQGAQVTADVYQRDLTAAQQLHIAAVVLFGDPYFYGGDRTVDRGSFSGRRDGLLGKRPNFTPGKTLVLSYCHSHDPICQGLLDRLGPLRSIDAGALTFRQHLNYTDFNEPQDAAALVAKLPAVESQLSPPIPTTPSTRLAARVSVGQDFACALTDRGGVQCWGDNTYGELGNGTTTSSGVTTNVCRVRFAQAAFRVSCRRVR